MVETSLNIITEHDLPSSSVKQMPTTLIRRQKSRFKRLKQIQCMNLFRLSLAALPTIVFGVFTIVFSLQQDASAKATREQDQRQADEVNRRIVFKEYIDDMKEILLDRDFQQNMNTSLLHIRTQTLTVLRNLDAARKHDIILFLYENHLLRRDQTPTVDLRGADLTGMKFIKSSTEACIFPFLYLPGVYAENIIFKGCTLQMVVFDDASMTGARFGSCNLFNSSFTNTNLTKAQFRDNHLYAVNFTGTSLVQSSIQGGIFQNVDMTNVDLHQSDISKHLWDPMINVGAAPSIVLNTRYPNGSFSDINSNDLILYGQEQSQCRFNATSLWTEMLTGVPVVKINASLVPYVNMPMVESECFFRIDEHKTVAQSIIVRQYSLLINLDQAMFNLSALVGLRYANRQGGISMEVHFGRDEGSFDYTRLAKRSIKNPSLFQFHSLVNVIPPMTKYMYVSFLCDPVSSKDQFCLFDQIQLSIFRKTS